MREIDGKKYYNFPDEFMPELDGRIYMHYNIDTFVTESHTYKFEPKLEFNLKYVLAGDMYFLAIEDWYLDWTILGNTPERTLINFGQYLDQVYPITMEVDESEVPERCKSLRKQISEHIKKVN